jgi:hypothetical protein
MEPDDSINVIDGPGWWSGKYCDPIGFFRDGLLQHLPIRAAIRLGAVDDGRISAFSKYVGNDSSPYRIRFCRA